MDGYISGIDLGGEISGDGESMRQIVLAIPSIDVRKKMYMF